MNTAHIRWFAAYAPPARLRDSAAKVTVAELDSQPFSAFTATSNWFQVPRSAFSSQRGHHDIPLALGAAEPSGDGALRWQRSYIRSALDASWIEYVALPPPEPAFHSPSTWAQSALSRAKMLAGTTLPSRPHEFPEIELKAFIDFPLPRFPEISANLREAVTRDRVPGWQIFPTWPPIEQRFFAFEMYGIDDPPEERGYVSYFKEENGTWLRKQKWFEQDKTERREIIQKIPADTSPSEDLRAILPGNSATVQMPAATRTRYKQKLRWLNSGNVYNLVLDHVETVEQDHVLQQAELEYSGSCSYAIPTTAEVVAELDESFKMIEGWFRNEGLAFQKTKMSKLSFLREFAERLG